MLDALFFLLYIYFIFGRCHLWRAARDSRQLARLTISVLDLYLRGFLSWVSIARAFLVFAGRQAEMAYRQDFALIPD